MRDQLAKLERLFDPQHRWTGTSGDSVIPAWRRVSPGEARWPVSIAMIAAIGLQVVLPDRLNLSSRFLLPAIEAALLLVLIALNPRRIDRASRPLRLLGLTLIAVASVANAYSAARLVLGLVNGTEGDTAGPLLSTGAAIYLTNILVFAFGTGNWTAADPRPAPWPCAPTLTSCSPRWPPRTSPTRTGNPASPTTSTSPSPTPPPSAPPTPCP